jgi:C-terminal processing protease CtpA/Prc
VTKKQLAEMSFLSLASSGDADAFYKLNGGDQGSAMREATVVTKPNEETELKFTADRCLERAFLTIKTEYYDSRGNLVYLAVRDPSEESVWTNFVELSAFGVLQQIACQKSYGGVGVRLANESGATLKITEVLEGLPAQKVGLKTNDIVTQIDGQSVSVLSAAQIHEKMRGPANSKVILTIARKDQEGSIKVTVVRENIQLQFSPLGTVE